MPFDKTRDGLIEALFPFKKTLHLMCAMEVEGEALYLKHLPHMPFVMISLFVIVLTVGNDE